MTADEQRQLVADFIKLQKLAVVSSIWDDKPQSAVVVFSLKSDFELIFGTFNTKRKHRNLKNNPNISVVIGWDDNKTVQYEGTAEEVGEADFDEYRQIHIARNPGSVIYAYRENQRYFKLTPRWIRYTDITPDPEFSFELNF
jgi:uncharacterized pyridoxamine 5'-phosphate oxidase family protein